jgi:SSS family solute:Na+ symporter
MMIVFFLSLALAVVVSLVRPARADSNLITMQGVSFRTTVGFNIAGTVIVAILIALYATWW